MHTEFILDNRRRCWSGISDCMECLECLECNAWNSKIKGDPDFSESPLIFLAAFKCTPYLPPICIPKPFNGELWFRSALLLRFRVSSQIFRPSAPLGFCSGGFSSTAGYVPGNEACRLSPPSDFRSIPVVPCRHASSRFYPGDLRHAFPHSSRAKPFGFGPERNDNQFPFFVVLDAACHHPARLSPCRSGCP